MIVRRILIAAAMAIALLIAGGTIRASNAETLIVNYFRYDDDFSFFDSVWLWPEAPDDVADEGERYMFDEDTDFGKQVEIDLNETNLYGATEVGVIVRGDTWDRRDVAQDLHIDMSEADDQGVVEVFLIQGVPMVYYSEEEADTSHRILYATFMDQETIDFRTTKEVENENVEVIGNGDTLAIDELELDGLEGTITLEEPIDLSKQHTLRADLGEEDMAETPIGLQGVYDSDEFHEEYGYDGDLGALYTEEETEFKLWAPLANSVDLNLYEKGHTASQTDYDGNEGVDEPYETISMEQGEQGVWSHTVDGDLDGIYYTFTVDNGELDPSGPHEVTDPYAYSVGLNGQRSMVVNFERQNPEGWEYGRSPGTIDSYADTIIYELHVRDLTSHESWDGTEDYRGKFLGLTEEGTTHEGVKTGFDHIKELGVTHVHLLPVMDFGMVDETRLDDEDYHGIHDGIFNWGYMPRHYNALEGSYSTDPYHGEVRVQEFKEMVQGFHEADIGVIMDVVYNHTGQSADSNFHQILPGYYHRLNPDGTFSNGSGTGNETASEREMFRKFMVDSLTFYAEEYNIDGFRFDLMKLHDVKTMNTLAEELHKIDEDIVIYGEPWTGGESLLPDEESAYKHTLDEMPDIAVFNDDSRDAIAQGSAFDSYGRGFVSAIDGRDHEVKLGITGGLDMPGLRTSELPDGAYATSPTQIVNYVSAHDNNTLHDKLVLATGADMDSEEDMADIVRKHRQANNIVLTSQGISFLHAGVEMLRTKPCIEPDAGEYTCDEDGLFDHNSYRSPDETNQFDWNRKVEYYDTFEFYRNLIHMRREKDVFTLASAEEIESSLNLMANENGLISYALHDEDDDWATTLVVHNNGSTSRTFDVPYGTWNVVSTTDEIGAIDEDTTLETLYVQDGGETITLDPNDSYIMYSETPVNVFATQPPAEDPDFPVATVVITTVGVLAVAGIGVAVYFYKKP